MRYVIAILAAIVLLPALAGAQAPEPTPWGDPDLQGVWTNRTTTPIERPTEFEERTVLSEEERAEFDAQAEAARDQPPPPGQTGSYNSFWFDRGLRSNQTSLIVDPPNGRYPAKTERVRESDPAFAAMRDGTRFDTWYDLNLYDRCITRGMPGAMLPGFYNHNYQILQTPDYVVILVEMIHDARIIPLDGRAHLTPRIGQWLGDSRGRWEGDTLVVETTNLTPKGDQRGALPGAGGQRAGEGDRAVHAGRRRPHRLQLHRHRSVDVREPVDRRDSDGAAWRRDLRVRVPRGELRAGEHPVGRPRRRSRATEQ